MNLWNFVRHQQITISFYLCFCFLWGIFWLLKWLFNCPLETGNCSAPCFFLFFSQDRVQTGWHGFKHRFRAKTIGIRYVWTSICSKTEKRISIFKNKEYVRKVPLCCLEMVMVAMWNNRTLLFTQNAVSDKEKQTWKNKGNIRSRPYFAYSIHLNV